MSRKQRNNSTNPANPGPENESKRANKKHDKTTRLNVTPIDILPKSKAPQDADSERAQFAGFAARHAEPWHRDIFAVLYPVFWQLNLHLFNAELKQPHFMIGMTAPRVLGFCKNTTDYGGRMQITLRKSLFDATHSTVHASWNQSVGVQRFIFDIVLHEMVHQYHFERTGLTEQSMGGHGKHFAKTCNDIARNHFVDEREWHDDGSANVMTPEGTFGPRIKKDSEKPQCWTVYTRRRKRGQDSHKRLAKYWPMNIRPKLYYGSDVSSCFSPAPRPKHLPTWAMVLENLVAYYESGRIEDFVSEARAELKKLQDVDCGECVGVWDEIWDEPICRLDALKTKGLPESWLGHLPSLARPAGEEALI